MPDGLNERPLTPGLRAVPALDELYGYIYYFDGQVTHRLSIGVVYDPGDWETEPLDVVLDPRGQRLRHPFEKPGMSTAEERAAVRWTW